MEEKELQVCVTSVTFTAGNMGAHMNSLFTPVNPNIPEGWICNTKVTSSYFPHPYYKPYAIMAITIYKTICYYEFSS